MTRTICTAITRCTPEHAGCQILETFPPAPNVGGLRPCKSESTIGGKLGAMQSGNGSASREKEPFWVDVKGIMLSAL